MIRQEVLGKRKVKYSYGPYNKYNDTEQWIRITEGCPHNCPYCYEPTEIKIFEMPEIVRNKVKILDMNLLCKPEAIHFLFDLGSKKVDNKVVYYELLCGVDYRFLTSELATILFRNRFGRFNKSGKFYKGIRIAWDWWYKDQQKIMDAVNILANAGYEREEIMIFMICNWKIPHDECIKKLDLCKVWGVKVCDCWFDNQRRGSVIPIHWNQKEIDDFGVKARKHNQLVRFGFDPQIIRN